MPYQGTNPRYPVRGGARESSSTRYSPYGKPSSERRSLEGGGGGYEGGGDALGSSGGRYNNNGAADYRASRRSPSNTGRYPLSRGYYDRDTDAAGGHLDDRSYGNRYEDEDGSENSFNIRGRGRGRGRGTLRGRGAHRGRGRGGHDHNFGRSPDEFYGYTRAAPRHAEFGGHSNEGPTWSEEYVPATQDASAPYELRNGQSYDTRYRQQSEYGSSNRRGPPNDNSMDLDGFRRHPRQPSFENGAPLYANEFVALRRPISQAGSYNQPQSLSRDAGVATDSPGFYKADIPPTPRKCTLRRTVFMRIPYRSSSISTNSIRSKLAEFGEIADLLDLHSKHVCYVMFYDSRDAANAVSTLRHNFYIGDANIEIVESRHRPDAFNRNPLKADFQATVLVSLVDANRGFEASDRAHFERFGEVCRFYPYFSSETEWVVEYYDYRSANDAAMSCHGQPACKGTMYTTFLWDDSVPCLEMGSALNSRVRRVEASSDTRADSARAFDKAAQRSGAAPVPAREPHQGEDPGRARERAQLPNLQVYPPVLPLASRSASIAQPASAPIPSSLAAMPLPGAKKRPSAATWMDSAISNTSSRSGSIDAARSSGNSQAKQEPPGVGREPAATAASMIDSVISRFAQDPGVMEKAKAAREILQQHKGLLGLSLPATAKATGAPSMLKPPLPPMSAPAPGPVVAAMTGASAVSALNQLVNRAPRYDSQSTIVADISPLIPSKDIDNTLSGLLGSPPSVFDLAKSANAAANAVHSAIATTVSMDNVSSEFMDMNVATNSSSTTATAVGTSAMLTLPKQGFGAPTSVSNHDEGINHLLGILAQVQRSSAAAAEVPKKF